MQPKSLDSGNALKSSETFDRLGIRGSRSGNRNIFAKQLESRNLSPIHQTPPDEKEEDASGKDKLK